MLDTGKNPISLSLNVDQYVRTLAFLRAMAQAGPAVVADELNKIAEMWRGQVVRHMPVDNGLARSSVQVGTANPHSNPVSAVVGTNVPYVVFLEFGFAGGTGLFAQTYKWSWGDEPATRWFAKDFDLMLLEHHGISRYWSEKEKKYVVKKVDPESIKKRLAGAYSPGTEEFAPPFRGSWQLIQDQVVQRLRNRVATLLRKGVL